jgi:hypothetical protein
MEEVAHNLSTWIMMLGAGMGFLGCVAFYFGLLPVGSMLMSIFVVSSTLYVFIRWWPEEEDRPEPATPVARVTSAVVVPRRSSAMVEAIRLDGPPRVRCLLALREMVRRQESFHISQKGAETFAKTIRLMLQQGK